MASHAAVIKYNSFPWFVKCSASGTYLHPRPHLLQMSRLLTNSTHFGLLSVPHMNPVLPHISTFAFKLNILLTSGVTALFLSFKSQLKYYFLRASFPAMSKKLLLLHPQITVCFSTLIILGHLFISLFPKEYSLQKSQHCDRPMQSCIHSARHTRGSQLMCAELSGSEPVFKHRRVFISPHCVLFSMLTFFYNVLV